MMFDGHYIKLSRGDNTIGIYSVDNVRTVRIIEPTFEILIEYNDNHKVIIQTESLKSAFAMMDSIKTAFGFIDLSKEDKPSKINNLPDTKRWWLW